MTISCIDSPAFTGTPVTGGVLTLTRGTWEGALYFTQQWLRDNAPIEGATDETYTTTIDDEGHTISVKVTASNDTDEPVTSESNGVEISPLNIPVVEKAPVLMGDFHDNGVVHLTDGSWQNANDFQFKWFADGVAIEGATGSSLTLTEDMVNTIISAEVTWVSKNSSTTI